MDSKNRKIWGVVLFVIGLIVTLSSIWIGIVGLIYGLFGVIVGPFIFFNKKEDEIEQIKGGK